MIQSAVTGWKVRNTIDGKCEQGMRKNFFSVILFFLIGLAPFIGTFIRKLWGHADWRKHYGNIFSSTNYLVRTVRGKITEKAISWHRRGRITESVALKLSGSFLLFFIHLLLSILPAGLHKFFTNWSYFKERLDYILIRPVRLYFNATFREEWLRDMVKEGQAKHIISQEDADVILSRVKEPFIQKYLKSLAVHVCTVPITQVVSVIIAIIYVLMHPEMPRAQSWGIGLGIIALFQVIPISPGSLTRGLYVLYLVIKERNFKDYNIAVFLGFFKYIGYLAFPIQMTYKYPTLARFMAGHWATEAVHVVPVFGESGALLEHGIYYLFYNWPLTIRRRMREKLEKRSTLKPRYWHVGAYAIIATALFGVIEYLFQLKTENLPTLKEIAVFIAVIPLFGGVLVSLGCGGASIAKRILSTVIFGLSVGMLYTAVSAYLSYTGHLANGDIIMKCIWRLFVITIPAVIGAIIAELK
jgi:hypothetical protein